MRANLKKSLLLVLGYLCFFGNISHFDFSSEKNESHNIFKNEFPELNPSPKNSFNGYELSQYNLSVIFEESTSSVIGNLSVNYYNNDPVNFTRIPFHLFLSGMLYDTRSGEINILNVFSLNKPNIPLTFFVNETAQLLWIYLDAILEPHERAFFEIEFNSIIPDGGYDRANSHGSDVTSSRIYKFTSFYPMPCVYDDLDGWNLDPYLDSCDPFYYDMAYYNLSVEAPSGMVIAATGELVNSTNKGSTIVHEFNPRYPVREVTFAASKFFQSQSQLVNGVIVSTYYLQESNFLWENFAIEHAKKALELFNNTFGSYPYPTLNIVEEYAFYLGMEYPLQVYIAKTINNDAYSISTKRILIEKTIVHEVAHQWWYNLVGFDQVDWGFLDEGLTTWSTDFYGRSYYQNWNYFQFTRYFDSVRTDTTPSRVNQSIYQIIESNLDFVFISYLKSPLILEKISRTIKLGNFTLSLKKFFEQNQFGIALLSDLQQALEETMNKSLDWLFFPWFDNYYLPKYRVTTIRFDEDNNNLIAVIEDENEQWNKYPYSQEVQIIVYNENGDVIYSNDHWINSNTTLVLSMSDKPFKLRLQYGNEVITQLTSATTTYLEIYVEEISAVISGYTFNFLLIIFFFSLIHLIFRLKSRKK